VTLHFDADLRLLNGLLPVIYVFLPLSPVFYFACIHICLYTVPLSVCTQSHYPFVHSPTLRLYTVLLSVCTQSHYPFVHSPTICLYTVPLSVCTQSHYLFCGRPLSRLPWRLFLHTALQVSPQIKITRWRIWRTLGRQTIADSLFLCEILMNLGCLIAFNVTRIAILYEQVVLALMIGKLGTQLLRNSMIYLCIHSPVKNDWAHNNIPRNSIPYPYFLIVKWFLVQTVRVVG
jgi:hypothetical protein